MQWVPLIFSKQASVVMAASNYGGASLISCGAAVAPPERYLIKWGSIFPPRPQKPKRDVINTLPDVLVGGTNMRLLEAANDLGFNWNKDRTLRGLKPLRAGCADCMLGCPRGAKWSSRIFGMMPSGMGRSFFSTPASKHNQGERQGSRR
jgi:hypothetical protein